MLNSKKLLFHALALICSVLLIIAVISAPAFLNGSEYNDSAKRQELAGQIDYICCGASHAMNAFNPAVLDKELNACTYNLSSASAYFHGRSLLLQKELDRNESLDAVIIEVSFDSLAAKIKEGHATGEPYIICKLDTVEEKFNYFAKHVDFFNNDYENISSVFMRYGLKAWKAMLCGEFGTIQSQKGFLAENANDVSLSETEVVRKYHSDHSNYDFRQENTVHLEEMIKACQTRNIPVIITVVPVSESCIWENTNMDVFSDQLKTLCQENDCMLLDFNLLKDRFKLFNDKQSFSDKTHISIEGSEVFSKTFAEMIKKVNADENVEEYFYETYSDMMQHSEYMTIYQSQQ